MSVVDHLSGAKDEATTERKFVPGAFDRPAAIFVSVPDGATCGSPPGGYSKLLVGEPNMIAGLKRFRILPALRLFALLFVVLGVSVCNQTPSATPDVPGNGGGGGGSGEGDNVLQTEALGFGGTVNGKVVGTQSTRGSTTTNEPGQAVPPDFDTRATRVHFKDLAGNDLRGADGQPLGEVALDSEGAFSAGSLPVGVDFTLCVDIGQDGTCDVESTIPNYSYRPFFTTP